MARKQAPEAPRFPRLTEPPDETYSLKALRSSGERVTPRNTDTFRKLSQAWHLDAWLYYNTLPECWYPAQFYSRALANIRLYAARKNENGDLEELEPTDWASEQLARIQDPGGGTSSLMSAFGQLMFVAGEGYLLGQVADGVEFWEFLSSSELRLQPATGAVAPKYLRYSYPGGIPEFITDAGPEDFEPVADQAVVYRIWKRHPQYSRLADSPVRAVLPLYQQLLLLEAAGTARAKSRIANAGILAVAQELDFGSADGENEDNPQTDPFAQRLYQAMSRAIAEPNSASAVAPPVIRVPSEMIASGGVWDHLKIHDSLEMYQEDARIEKVVGRIATGLDMPPELLLGLTDANHWTSWQIDDQTWTAHLQPVVQRLVDDLSAAFLRPLAIQEGQENPEELCIGYDNSRVVNHPDRAKDAKDLYAEGVLSAEKLRESTGFSEDDAPTEEEHREWLTIKLRGQAQADVIEGKTGNTDGAGAATGNTETVKKAPSEQKLQDEDAAVTAALVHRTLGAAELALERCREYAGSKLVTRVKQRKQDRLLTGISGVPTSLVASSLGADNLALLEAPAAAELVKGGCASFVATVTRWGVTEMTARRIASLVETEAAQSLTADCAVLPARVTAYVTKALGG